MPRAQRSRKVSYRAAALLCCEPPSHSRSCISKATSSSASSIVRRACEEPIRQIVLNGGIEGAIVVEKIKKQHHANFGFNAETEQYEDLVKAGVIDPTKVTRTALQNAASIASLMLTTEAMICGLVEETGG